MPLQAQQQSQELNEAVQQAKQDSEATGLNALARDFRLTSEAASDGLKDAGNKITDGLKATFGMQTSEQQERFQRVNEKASKLKTGEVEPDFYTSRKRARYQ